MAVQRRYGAVIEQIADIEQLLKGQSMFLAGVRIGSHII